MTTDAFHRLVVHLVEIEFAITALLTLLLLATAEASRRRARRHEAHCTRGREVLARAITAPQEARVPVDALAGLPWTVAQELVLDFGGSLTGSARARLTAVGSATGIAQRAEALCRSRWWWRRLAGARVLTALDDDSAAVRPLLHDRHALVRAQALVWAAGRSDEPVIDELVSHLADSERLCRFTVRDSLLRLGRPAAKALARFLMQPGQRGLADGLAVARGLAQPELLEPALMLAAHPNDDVRARAAMVLGVIGGDRAVVTLGRQLHDPAGAVRAAAARALGDLGSWQTSPILVRLLGDTSWPVRRESALALRRMGSVGLLALRRARTAENPFSADMARQVLELPESVYQRVTA